MLDESENSDEELQAAFQAGQLKTGLNFAATAERTYINNVAGLKSKLAELQQSLAFPEQLVVVVPCQGEDDTPVEALVDDDFQRELAFYRQGQEAVKQLIPRLKAAGVLTRRPVDYYAEMVKSDSQMKKIREKLAEREREEEQREKIKKHREMRKQGKKVQQEILAQRDEEKKAVLEAVKNFRKGKLGTDLDAVLDKKKQRNDETKKKFGDHKQNRRNQKREHRDEKYGHGGQKKRSKSNTKSSHGEDNDFRVKVNQPRGGKAGNLRRGGKGAAPQRKGKVARRKGKK